MTVKAVVNGQEIALTYNSTTAKYEATVTAPISSSYQNNDGHYFPVVVAATDEAGNTTTISDTEGEFTEYLKLYAKEQIKPTVTEISPSSGANITTTATPKIEFTVLDNGNGQSSGFAGINPDSVVLTIGNTVIDNSKITKAAVIGGYQCSYTPETAIADGNCTFSVKVSDYDGNESETVSTTINIDTVPPGIDITSPVDGTYSSSAEIEIVGTATDATSSPVTVAIKVGDIDQGTVTVQSDGSFSKTVKLQNGSNKITVTATDSAGKTSTVVRTVILKTSAPVFKSVTITPNPVNCGQTYTISVEVE